MSSSYFSKVGLSIAWTKLTVVLVAGNMIGCSRILLLRLIGVLGYYLMYFKLEKFRLSPVTPSFTSVVVY
jgi:hypothetical protein